MTDYTDENMRYGQDDFAADADGHASFPGRGANFDENHDCVLRLCSHGRCEICRICPNCQEEEAAALMDIKKQADELSVKVPHMMGQRNALLQACKVIVAGFSYDPGHSDLDDEQPIHVSMTLGDYRRARRAVAATEATDAA